MPASRTFCFRLWIAIDTGQGALVKDGLPSELDYLSGGAAGLLEGRFAGHTSKEVYERVLVPVKNRVPGASRAGTLVVPDLDGEQILTIYRNRRWSAVWEDLISNRCACLLFVRAGSDAIVAPLDWATCFEKYGDAIDAPRADRGEVAQVVGSAGSDSRPGGRRQVRTAPDPGRVDGVASVLASSVYCRGRRVLPPAHRSCDLSVGCRAKRSATCRPDGVPRR